MKVGDVVTEGQVLCIVEAMKLMNEIESEVSGTVKEIALSNGDPVQFGQVLFRIEPNEVEGSHDVRENSRRQSGRDCP